MILTPSFSLTSFGYSAGGMGISFPGRRRSGGFFAYRGRNFHYNGPADPRNGKGAFHGRQGDRGAGRDGGDPHRLQPGEEERAEPEDPQRAAGGPRRRRGGGHAVRDPSGGGDGGVLRRVRHHPDPRGRLGGGPGTALLEPVRRHDPRPGVVPVPRDRHAERICLRRGAGDGGRLRHPRLLRPGGLRDDARASRDHLPARRADALRPHHRPPRHEGALLHGPEGERPQGVRHQADQPDLPAGGAGAGRPGDGPGDRGERPPLDPRHEADPVDVHGVPGPPPGRIGGGGGADPPLHGEPGPARGEEGVPGKAQAQVPGTLIVPRPRLAGYGLPLLTGLLIGTSYIPFPPWALLFCHVPLWIFWLREGSVRRILWGGWLAQFLFCLIGFHWVAYTAHEFGQMGWPLAILVLLLFCAFGHLYLVLAGLSWALLRGRLRLSRTAQLLLLPVVTAICHRYVPLIFPWNLGYPWLWSRLPAFQLAEFAGFDGLGVLTLFLNLSLLAAWERRNDRAGALILGGTAAFLIAMNAAGWVVGRGQPAPDAEARVLVVQGNVGNLEKRYAKRGLAFRDDIIGKYFRLTRQGLGKAGDRVQDFVVWPETAFPDILRTDRMYSGYAGVLQQFVGSGGVPLVTGAIGYDDTSRKPTNAMFFFDRNGALR